MKRDVGPALDSAELAATTIAAMRELLTDERRARLDAACESRLASVTVVLENLYNPHNGAAALRSCEALGLHEICVVGDPLRFTSAVTQGCDKWLELKTYPDIAACAASLRARGFQLVAAVPSAKTELDQIDATRPTAFLLGNEQDGLTDAARALCDVEYTIPMAGLSESFNLSVATAVSLYSFTQRRRATLGRRGDLEGIVLEQLRARYYSMDVRGARSIVERYQRLESPDAHE